MDPTIQLDASVDKAVDMVSSKLSEQGFRVLPSFDLRQAASAHLQCTCPAHGTDECTCQYLMLIAYPNDVEHNSLTIAVHSHAGNTFVSLIEGEEASWLGAMLPLVTETNSEEQLIKGEPMSSKTFTVPNISCGHCTHTIEREIGEMPGVKNIRADIASKQIVVEWNAPATWEKIKAMLIEINYAPAN